MKRKIFGVIFVLTILLCVPLAVNAEIIDSGECGADGDNVTWTLDDTGTLTISGEGEMFDFASKKECPWYELRQLIKNVKIESGVTSIGDNADINQKSITIPKSVTKIGKAIFKNITFYDYSGHIYYEGSIYDWKKIKIVEEENADLHRYVIVYGYTKSSASQGIAVSGSYFDVLSWTLDVDGVMNIECVGDMSDMSGYGRGAPWTDYKTDIKKVVLPEGLTRIGSSAFAGCVNLTEINLPDTLKELGYNAFNGCSKLREVTIPKSVTYIEGGVFSGTSAIEERNGFQLVGDALVGYTGTDKEVIVPDGVRIVADEIFTDEAKENMTKIVFPDEVEYIGIIFTQCKNLVDITFPANLKRILRVLHANSYVQNFSDTPWLENQPDGVVYINDIAYCYHGENPDIIEVKEGTRAIGDFFTGSSKNGWRSETKKIILPDSLERIECKAFAYCSSLEEINIPDNVKYIDWGAFQNCGSLKSITIPDSVTNISDTTFQYCSGLTSITIPDSVTSIDEAAFQGCFGLTDVYYGGSETDWENINVDDYGNDSLLNATIHYNAVGTAPPKIDGAPAVSGAQITIPLADVEYDSDLFAVFSGEKGMISFERIGISAGDTKKNASIPSGAETVKVFIWGSITGMKPLCEAAEVQIR